MRTCSALAVPLLESGAIHVLPLSHFLDRLDRGDILGGPTCTDARGERCRSPVTRRGEPDIADSVLPTKEPPVIRLSSLLAASLTVAPFAIAQAPNFTATAPETVWNTDFTIVASSTGPYQVLGGLFVFDTVTIPAGTTLRGTGSRPMIIVCNQIQIDGTIDASGGNGARIDTLGMANFPALGGQAGPAGGNGGDSSPNAIGQSWTGRPGRGPLQFPGGGGGGGNYSLPQSCDRGSGGGGGSFATTGDPHYKFLPGIGVSFVQGAGYGGFGCLGVSGAATRVLPGGGPGARVVVDARPDNDFFGLGYDVFTQQVVSGELQLVGGAGGGGGGNKSSDNLFLSPNFVNDARGGAGGGGGGCLAIVAINNIVVGPLGRIRANGGHGGGGEQVGSCNQGGGGGGGSGGFLILAARGTIDLHVKGETYANNNYDFVLSADGGVCLTGAFLSPTVTGKYGVNGSLPLSGTNYDLRPLGGFGGMGAIQLMTFPGTNADGTNTVLDDNVNLFANGVLLTGATKQRFLAWRGYQNAVGVPVDDFGAPTNIGSNEGDIRPSPALLPMF